MLNKLYADTADIQAVKELDDLGIIQGVTTNPSILAKDLDFSSYKQKLKELVDYTADRKLSISVELFEAKDKDKMVQEAKELKGLLRAGHPKFFVKVPITDPGLSVIKELKRLGLKVNCTACFDDPQMIVAALAGADYVSLFYNRAKDAGEDVADILRKTRNFIDANWLSTNIIAGSIRHSTDITDAWDMGAHIVTASPALIKLMTHHNGSVKSVEGFVKDFEAWSNQKQS